MERLAPLYTPLNTAIMNGIDNLRVGKEDYFHLSVFYVSYFIKEIENILSPCGGPWAAFIVVEAHPTFKY